MACRVFGTRTPLDIMQTYTGQYQASQSKQFSIVMWLNGYQWNTIAERHTKSWMSGRQSNFHQTTGPLSVPQQIKSEIKSEMQTDMKPQGVTQGNVFLWA